MVTIKQTPTEYILEEMDKLFLTFIEEECLDNISINQKMATQWQ